MIETGANHARFMQKLGQESWKEEEEEDQDIGANKVFKKVREKSKIRNSLDHEEKYDEKEPEEWHSKPGLPFTLEKKT